MKKLIIISIFSLVSIGWGCIDDVEVELWGECYNIEETTSLELSGSGLTGEIPPEIGDLTNLTYLNLYGNQLTGEIPPEIGQLTNLLYLFLYMNQLSGQIPSEIGNLVNLIILRLNDNNLSGEIPGNICDLTIDWSGVIEIHEIPLPYFDVNNNNLCPPYPECIEDNIGYQDTSECEEPLCDEGYVWIENIPINDWGEGEEDFISDSNCFYQSDLDVLQKFIDNSQLGENSPPFDLSPVELGNQKWEDGRLIWFTSIGDSFYEDFEWSTDYELSGEIPTEIGDLEFLLTLDIRHNQISGHIPSEIGNLNNLYVFNLKSYYLEGEIPETIWNLEELRMFYIDSPYIYGNIPLEIQNLFNLEYIGIENTQMSGSIPDELWEIPLLDNVHLSNNNFSGNLHSELCDIILNNFDSNYDLTLSNNQLCPPYPECISQSDIDSQDTSECLECSDTLGDLNDDMIVNVLDIITIVNCIVSDDICDDCYDISGDGIINVIDIISIVNIIIND